MDPDLQAQELETVLSEDISAVCAREAGSFDRIIADFGSRFVLFGAGALGRTSLGLLLQDGLRPLAFSDNNPALWNTEIAGIPVRSPVETASRHADDAAFFVTIWSEGRSFAEARAGLDALGCKHVFPVAPIRWKYPADLLPFLCQDLPHKVYEQADQVRAAYRLWADRRSREEYLAQVRDRALGDPSELGSPTPETSYFPESLFRVRTDETFIDCGASDGDTIRELTPRCGGRFRRILALEPDPERFEALQRYAGSLPDAAASRISLRRCAVSSHRGSLQFDVARTALSASGGTAVDAIPLDELTAGLTPTFVKMDIEGAEFEALQGARRVISESRPLLAVCLYHRQDDLWRIPLLIHSLYPGYTHFLRAHAADGWQTVGYAVPRERLEDPGVGAAED